MTSNFTEMEQLRFLSTAARLANKERISALDERWIRGYLDRYAPSQPVEPGFPEAPGGDAGHGNNLRRTNWFNGRYLTAEALSRQDVYFDHRARLNAHALMPGIAWGLGLTGQGLNQLGGQERRGGFAVGAPLTLRRGLAFDGVGRPILVSEDYSFTLAQLIGVSLKSPRRVVGGQREFTPCVCLAPDSAGPSGGGAALPSGPYLLVIEAGELPQGRAKVTGDVCGGRRGAPCEAEAWQGSFGLSLVRFPVDAPLLNAIPDVWALRGTLSAYYFDVFEHPLWRRWDPAFPVDGSFGRDSGPGRHEGMAIPLALVHLGEDGTALYLDSWIPRRLITATPGEDWHRVRFGAPPRAAAWARIHQFQTMLAERLEQDVRTGWKPGRLPIPFNLYQGGFRHIPPIGFLPIWPTSVQGSDEEPRLVKRTACTTFAPLNGQTEGTSFSGKEATFIFITKPVMTNVPSIPIAQPWPSAENGSICLFINPYRGCRIDLQHPAVEVRLRLAINGSVDLRALDADGKELGAIDPTGATMNELRLITSQQSGIRSIQLQAKDGQAVLFLAEFCYDYLEASTSVPSPSPSVPLRSALVREALRQGEAYFRGTNVIPYGVVALHDDDILEDLHHVIDKDPLQLEPSTFNWSAEDSKLDSKPIPPSSSDRIAALGLGGLAVAAQGGRGVWPFLRLLGRRLSHLGEAIEPLVNRRVEVVKLVVPLQGLSRQHPLLGALPEDAVWQARDWGLAGAADLSAASLAGLLRERGIAVLPRSHVVYVKQRLVLLDLVFLLLELLPKLVEVALVGDNGDLTRLSPPSLLGRVAASPSPTRSRALLAITTKDYTAALRAQSETDQQLIRATLQQPVVQDLLLQTMLTTAPGFANAERSQAFLDQVRTRERDLPATISEAGERQARALAEVADAWAAEDPAAQVLQLLAAVQPAERTLELVQRLGAAPGPVAGPTVADGLDLQPPSSFASNTGRVLYAEARQRLDKRLIQDLALDPSDVTLPKTALVASLTVADVLARRPEEAANLLGGPEQLAAVTQAFLSDREAALEASSALAEGVPAAVVATVASAVAEGAKPDDVLHQLREEEEAKPEPERDNALLRSLTHAETLLRVSGNQLGALWPLQSPPGG